MRNAQKILLIILCALLALTGSSQAAEQQTSQTLSDQPSETLSLLKRFNDNVSATTANAFFQQLLSEEFIDETIHFDDNTPPDTLRAQVWYWAGEYLNDNQKYAEATQYLVKALLLLKAGADRSTLADCLNLMAVVYVRLSEYDKAAQYALQCYQLDEASGDPDLISSSLNSLAGIYMTGGQPKEAEQYILKAIDVAHKADNPARMAVLQGMASEVYHALGRDNEALKYADEAYRLDIEGGREGRAMVRLAQKASVLLGLNRWEEAEQLLTEVIPFFRNAGEQHSLGIALNKMGMALLSQKRQAESVPYYREAAQIFSQIGDMANELHSHRGLYESLWEIDPDSAKAELERFNDLKDSIYNSVSAEKLARYNAEFGNDWLQIESHAQRKAKSIALALAAAALLLAAATWWIMRRRHRREQQLNEQLSADISQLREQYQELNMHYDKAMATRPAADDEKLSESDKAFLEQIVKTTNTMIADGQVDATTVAAQMGMSLFQLRQRLSTLTGDTPQAFIQNIRMRRARYLLDKHRQLNITEVARLCGYSDTPNFTRAFKKAFGVTPTQYKPPATTPATDDVSD